MATGTQVEGSFRNPLDSFTDREQILAHFRHLLHSAQTGEFHLLAVKGHSGTGKTFLIEYLSKRLCPQAGWQTGVLAFVQSFPDFRSILEGLEDALKGGVPRQSLMLYRKQREDYKRRFDEYRATIVVNQTVQATDASSVSHIQMHAQVNAELRRREAQLRAELTGALLELAEECAHPLCLFIDGYERLVETDSELLGWLWEVVLLNLAKKASQPVLVVTCGWEYPSSAALQPFSTNDELDDFDLLRITAYLQARSIISPETSAHASLVSALYDLTRGHPLVLALAVTYVQTIAEPERMPESLRTHQPLLSEEARVQWLEERLLNRLPEPYCTLLERGPILRTFDQAALQVLLRVGSDEHTGERVLDDRTYARFLQYPFINRKTTQSDALLERPTFHDLTRRVRLEALRRWHPDTRQRLHHVMADYYRGLIEAEQQPHPVPQAEPSQHAYAEWFAEIPEQQFSALLEWLYHALQVKDLQAEAFQRWDDLMAQAVLRWRRKQAGPLLELVKQVAEEEEPFLHKHSEHYGQYLIWYSWFLQQEARWDDARIALQDAAWVFEQGENHADQATCLNNIGAIYNSQGQLDTALDYYQHALALKEQVGNPADIALSLNNIGDIYRQQGQLDTALDYYQRALALKEQVGNPADIALSLNNIGGIYNSQGQLDTALDYYLHALALKEQVGNPADIALSLNNIGAIYNSQGQLEMALDYHLHALALFEQVGNPADIALSLNNIGRIYDSQGQLDAALDYCQRALTLKEQVGNPADIALSLNNIGMIYNSQGQLDTALDYLQRALALREQVGNPADIAGSLNNIGAIYDSQGQLDTALDYCQRALALKEQVGNPADIALSFNNIGMIYDSQGQLEMALDYHLHALALFEQVGNPANIALSLNNIGAIYDSQGQLDTALDYFQHALALFEQVGNPADIALSLNNIGMIYNSQGQLEMALDYHLHALALFEQVGNPANIAGSLNNIGAIYDSQGQLDAALDYYQRALALFEQVGNPADVALSLNNIGMIYDSQGQLEMALDYHLHALALFEQVGNPANIARSCHNIASLRLQQEQWQDATRLHLRALSLYERMGHGFESNVADELEGLAYCFMQLGESEREATYTMLAKQIREQLQRSKTE
jgi:tetratricopeptide (TPR) repeat protein